MLNVALPNQVSLLSHPSTPSETVQSLEVQLSMPVSTPVSPNEPAALLTLRYKLQGDLSRIRVPAETDAARADGLWKHTCFEAFIQPEGMRGYYEFNFSPSRQWAAYRFDGYREGMRPIDLTHPPEISVRKSAHQLELEVTWSLPSAATGAASGSRLALTAVVEEENGRLCYWSARHPQGKPDFHHADGFVLQL
jgi:hypothetical protein